MDGSSKSSGGGFGDSLVLFAAPAADADGADYSTGTL
jgi:mevalonate kinase